MRKSEATAGSPVPTAEVGIGNRKALSRKARTSSGALVSLMPGGQPLRAGNFPFVHCTFLFCFAPRKPFALFCRAKKFKKRWKLHRRRFYAWYYQVARYWRLPLMSGIALFQVLCRFPDLRGATALRLKCRGHGFAGCRLLAGNRQGTFLAFNSRKRPWCPCLLPNAFL